MAAFNAAATTPAAYVQPSGAVVVPDAPRFARPTADVSNGGWTPSVGTDLYAVLDEVTPDATDYISADPMGGTPVSCELALGPIADPGTSAGQVVRYEAHSPGGTNLTVTLKQGAATIASRTHASLPTTPTIHELVLNGPQCDAITNYRDLRLVFTVA
jgi:hypothetical protein